jgi:L,D-peptidoglycan transpeptidase YkuD (ErfK/YbiS/YcfS/YnhG family)
VEALAAEAKAEDAAAWAAAQAAAAAAREAAAAAAAVSAAARVKLEERVESTMLAGKSQSAGKMQFLDIERAEAQLQQARAAGHGGRCGCGHPQVSGLGRTPTRKESFRRSAGDLEDLSGSTIDHSPFCPIGVVS